MTILDDIIEDVRRRVEGDMESPLVCGGYNSRSGKSLKEAIEKEPEVVSIISELKRSSPSSGVIREDFPVLDLANQMTRGGATGISVLTESEYFGGSPEYLVRVRESVEVPILRKDFIVDTSQLYDSALMGADAVLLISGVLGDELFKFVKLARSFGLDPLVEVGDREEVDLALDSGAGLIGINNRDLDTMEVDLARTEELIECVPNRVKVVSESGMKTRADVERVGDMGADAALIGTAIMESGDVEAKVRELASGGDLDG